MMRVAAWTGPGAEWDAFVRSAGDATVMHLHAWRAVMERAYGHRTFYLAAFEGGELAGVLPLTLIRSPFLGASLVSMPFMDYGGVCLRPGGVAERPLVEAAQEVARQQRARLVLRYLRKPTLDLPCSLEKVTTFLNLGGSEEELWRRLPSERRNRIRKGQKQGLSASFPGAEGLADFYGVFATNMRDLGSPVHSLAFFREVLGQLGDHARIVIVRYQGQPVGAGLMLLFAGMISMPWVSSLRRFFDRCPNQVLYWEAMRFGIGHGYRVLDLGRSSRGSGTFEAKRQWGGQPVQLYWHYHPASAEPPGEDVRRLGWAARLWRRLPVPMANTVGPWLRRALPN